MNKTGLFIGVAILIAVVACFLPLPGGQSIVEKTTEAVGGVPFDIYHALHIHGAVTTGGAVTNASTTLTAADTLTAAEVCDSGVITYNSAAVAGTQSAASLDVTLPATTTLFTTCLKAVGDSHRFLFANESPTAASTTQIVAGTGIDLQECDDGSDCNVEIGGLSYAWIEITRIPYNSVLNIDAVATVLEFSPAD